MQQFQDIRFDVDGGVATLTLNRPAILNALSWASWAEIETVIARVNTDDDVKVLIVTGEGRGFCSGTDLSGLDPGAAADSRPRRGRSGKIRSRELTTADVYHCKKPVIAAVNGVAAGGGLSLALACDIRIASTNASFSAVFVRRALVADTGTTWYLPRIVGVDRALELIYTGRMIEAAEALEIGLVTEVVTHDMLLERATELAREIAAGPSFVIELDKRLVRESFGRRLEDQIELEQMMRIRTRDTEDAKEGVQAFRERRRPIFRGR
ncbi:enoyl-CoA hydratase/isomerase family protein [Nocardia sp. SC052]|uniref:enoyl-CoA hydratase/isomerase family protein n=1 Tax=Nocardia sichangensis TaxID=3385975 RepID=UPI0039A3E24C